MKLSEKDRNTLNHMIKYCDEIDETMDFFGNNYESFEDNKIYRNAVVLCILQIGELVTHFTDDFRAEYREIKWQEIKGLRNIIAHRYGTVNEKQIWSILDQSIPLLEKYCKEILEF